MSPIAQVHTIALLPRDAVAAAIAEFLLDRAARGLFPRTVAWYSERLAPLRLFLSAQGVTALEAVTPSILRAFLLEYSQTHNPGGVHGVYRAARAFLNWWATEHDAPNPIAKIAAPRMTHELLEPVTIDTVRAMLATCRRRTAAGARDRALLLFLLDSGCRRAEFLALNVGDVVLATGAVMVRHGKGDKARMAFIGARARRALAAYVGRRGELGDAAPLWIDAHGGRLSPTALRAVLIRRARAAGVPAPSPHAFRRAFAIACLRAGMDLVTLQRLLGHSSLAVVSRYLRQIEGDLAEQHRKASPADNWRLRGKGPR